MLLNIRTGDEILIPVKVVGTRTGMNQPTEYAVGIKETKVWLTEKELVEMGFGGKK